MDFKFVSHVLWSEKQNIVLQHMHKKAVGHGPLASCLIKLISTFNSQIQNSFLCMC
jgi:hypothetical protein